MDRKSLGRFEVVGVALVFPMIDGSWRTLLGGRETGRAEK